MTNKTYGIIGMITPLIFWVAYFILSTLHLEYSMFTKAISELGSLYAPNKWIWNSLGYILPGLLISFYAFGLYKNVAEERSSKTALYGILLSGIFMIISGIFPGDFDNRQSTTMLLHTVGSMGSYVFFLIGAFTYPKLMDKTDYWKTAKKPTLIFTYLTILFGAWAFVVPNIPALGQRIVFFFYFLWIFYTAVKLYKHPKNSVSNNRHK